MGTLSELLLSNKKDLKQVSKELKSVFGETDLTASIDYEVETRSSDFLFKTRKSPED